MFCSFVRGLNYGYETGVNEFMSDSLPRRVREPSAAGETWRRPGIVENNGFFHTQLSWVLRFKPHFWHKVNPLSKYNLSQMVAFWRLAKESDFYRSLFTGVKQNQDVLESPSVSGSKGAVQWIANLSQLASVLFESDKVHNVQFNCIKFNS